MFYVSYHTSSGVRARDDNVLVLVFFIAKQRNWESIQHDYWRFFVIMTVAGFMLRIGNNIQLSISLIYL